MPARRIALLVASGLLALAIAACDGGDGAGSFTPTPEATGPAVTATPTVPAGARLSTVDIVRRLRPSVVQVLTEIATFDLLGRPQLSQGIGTGVIIDEEGHIVTNNHVVRVGDEIASRVTITLNDGRTADAEVIGTDPQTDLAVLQIDASGLTPAVLGDSESLPVGAEVVAIGHALGLEGGPSITRGVVSAKNRTIEQPDSNISINGLIQTDASINPGNSGGPLVDDTGRVVGINTAIIGDAQNIGFAIAVDLVRPIAEELIRNGRVDRGYLGVLPQDVTPGLAANRDLPTDEGIVLLEVVPGSPADAAGLQPGDIVIGLADVDIENSGDLLEALRVHRQGEEVTVRFYRDGDEEQVDVALGESPEP